MARRFIALEIEAETLQLAVSTLGEDGPQLVEVRTVAVDSEAGLEGTLKALREELQPGLADTVELLMPASHAYVRKLHYPFKGQRKLANIIPPDFSYRLPEESDQLVVDYTVRRVEGAEASEVDVAAISTQQLREKLAAFKAADFSLTGVSLLPWSLAGGAIPSEERQLWVWQRQEEVGIALFDGERIVQSLVSTQADEDPESQVAWLLHQAQILERREGWQGLPMRLFGGPIELRRGLEAAGRKVLTTGLEGPGDVQQSRVVQLALEGIRSRRKQRHNFLRGEFAPTGGWQSLREPLRMTLALFAVLIVIATTVMWSGYQRQRQEAEQLEQQAEKLLRTTFPEIRTLRDPAVQLQSQLQQLRKQAGSAPQDAHSPLKLLRAMSQNLPEGVSVQLQEWVLASGEIRLEGRTGSFEEVDRIAESFNRIPGVTQAIVAESKLGSDEQVVFRMRLVLGASS